jgi:hypothetical protein
VIFAKILLGLGKAVAGKIYFCAVSESKVKVIFPKIEF